MDREQTGDRLQEDSELAKRETGLQDDSGAPTWPITVDSGGADWPPPVGLNWGTVAKRLGVDIRILAHDGEIVLAGEYFPEAGYALDIAELQARFADVGNIALRTCYFLGELAMRNFAVKLTPSQVAAPLGTPVSRSIPPGPVIGLFLDERQAQRAKRKIMQGSLGGGVSLGPGPLGIELRVDRPNMAGRVATVIASHRGAVISIGGVPLSAEETETHAVVAGPTMMGEQANARRPGTGSTGQAQAPALQWGGSEEVNLY